MASDANQQKKTASRRDLSREEMDMHSQIGEVYIAAFHGAHEDVDQIDWELVAAEINEIRAQYHTGCV